MQTAIGYRLAQLGAAIMIIGGAVDLSVRRLLPHHLAALGGENGSASESAERLLVALLHALGGALVASGIAVLFLIYLARKRGDRLPFIAAVLIAILAEGPNAWGIFRADSSLYVGPLSAMVLISMGAILCMIRPAASTQSQQPVRSEAPGGVKSR